jgi:hypothetical protein
MSTDTQEAKADENRSHNIETTILPLSLLAAQINAFLEIFHEGHSSFAQRTPPDFSVGLWVLKETTHFRGGICLKNVLKAFFVNKSLSCRFLSICLRSSAYSA